MNEAAAYPYADRSGWLRCPNLEAIKEIEPQLYVNR
ncbi:hypothetical protein FHX05_004083 [Rhizobium sp. BK491]|nr:hypothetical protein [Rhizobium sp. BK491]